MPLTPAQIQMEASAYRIWREGSPIDWCCTVAELAEATGISPRAVRHICSTRKWPVTSRIRRFLDDSDERDLISDIRIPVQKRLA